MPPLNSEVHVLCTIIKDVKASTTEAEIAAVFCSCQKALPLHQTLIFMGHPMPPTPVQVDNKYAVGKNNANPKLWICVFIGRETGLNKVTFTCIGEGGRII